MDFLWIIYPPKLIHLMETHVWLGNHFWFLIILGPFPHSLIFIHFHFIIIYVWL
jgi:hypothetical protein